MSFIEFYVKLYAEIKSFNEMPPKFLKSIDPTRRNLLLCGPNFQKVLNYKIICANSG